MNALDKIAELHARDDKPASGGGIWVGEDCVVCRVSWPCPTRRLCDEAVETK